MKIKARLVTGMLAACGLMVGSSAVYADGYANKKSQMYEVTITNLTRSQTFTPILVSSQRYGVSLFELGSPASDELSALAEGGDVAPQTAVLEANKRVIDVANSGGLLAPGASVSVKVSAKHGAKWISVASMMIPTNDAFISMNGVKAPRGGHSVTYYSPAYDAGSEPNDELCISMPGPVCAGEGGSPGASGEGYVHVHAGIHGIGDLDASVYDWRNPAAKITIRRIK